MNAITTFLTALKNEPEHISFAQTMAVITQHYTYHATTFTNGNTVNTAGTNEGSCKIFAFAQCHQLTPEQTLACFGDYYRIDVLQNPQGDDHANIRNFMQSGWAGIQFEGEALKAL